MIWQFWQDPLKKLDKQRQQALSANKLPPLVTPLFQLPLANGDTPLYQLPFVALDFETSGLDFMKDRILSIGMVEIKQQVLQLSTARHYYLSASEAVNPQTAVINHIRPEVLTFGLSEKACLQQLIPHLAGKIIIAHCASIEKNFLKKALNLPQSVPLPLIFLDTLCLAGSLAEYRGKSNPDLRLASIRKDKGLPAYLAHNAVADAIATGELFLALIAEIFPQQSATLKQVIKQSALFHT